MDVYKSIGNSVTDVDVKGGKVTGYFSSFDTKDSDGDIIRKGAYAKTILEWGPKSNMPRIKHLVDHDRTKTFTKLQELTEDDIGLYYYGIPGRDKFARDFLLKCEDGIITEHSVKINPIQQKWDNSSSANIISECKMWEGSSLHCWGANENTPLLSVEKSLADLKDMYARLEKALKNGIYTDETMQEFQLQYDQIGELLKATQPPGKLAGNTEPDQSQASSTNYLEIFKNAVLYGN